MSFQATSSQQGAMFDAQARYLLDDAGFVTSDRPFVVPSLGVEIDIAADRDDLQVWVEAKGSWRGDRPGLLRTDSAKKAILAGALMCAAGGYPPFVIITTHRIAGWVADVICTANPDDIRRMGDPGWLR